MKNREKCPKSRLCFRFCIHSAFTYLSIYRKQLNIIPCGRSPQKADITARRYAPSAKQNEIRLFTKIPQTSVCGICVFFAVCKSGGTACRLRTFAHYSLCQMVMRFSSQGIFARKFGTSKVRPLFVTESCERSATEVHSAALYTFSSGCTPVSIA